MCYFFFFFFKQKTAYEMRISDWSSDVCSSDLDLGRGRAPQRQPPQHPSAAGNGRRRHAGLRGSRFPPPRLRHRPHGNRPPRRQDVAQRQAGGCAPGLGRPGSLRNDSLSATARTIGIVDYGMGNLRSVCNALAEIGAPAELFSDPQRAADYDKIIIPGLGAFQEAMEDRKSVVWGKGGA